MIFFCSLPIFSTFEMGIKFHCPSGHKLNVKSFLAGKKAVCPKCGERVLVPNESEAAFASSSPAEEPEAPGSLESMDIAVAPTASLPNVAAKGAVPSPTVQDPLAEAPAAAWYVRPSAGGQYGPAASDMMRSWLAEGRVPADALVWRAGWPEWRLAMETFPQLGAVIPPMVSPTVPMAAPVTVAPVSPSPVVGVPRVAAAVGRQVSPEADLEALIGLSPRGPAVTTSGPRVRQRRKDGTIIVSGILAALVLILFVILGIVLWKQGDANTAETPPPKPKPVIVMPEEAAEEDLDSELADPAPVDAENPAANVQEP